MKNMKIQAWVFVIFMMTTTIPGIAAKHTWTPPLPNAAEQDWVKLTSGEWLWGSIDLMRDEDLSFDSDNLDDLSIDWEDISEIRSARIMTYVLNDGTSISGTSTMKDGIILIETPQGVTKVIRLEVSAILDGKSNERNFWSAKIGSDLKVFTGNTDQSNFGNWVMIKREAIRSRLDLKYQGNFTKINGLETVNNHRSNADWKIFISRRFFLTPVMVELYSDEFKNVDLRSDLGAGFGYFLRRDNRMDLFVETGGSFSRVNYSSVLPGEEDRASNAIIPLKITLETSLTKRVDLTVEYKTQLGLGHDANTLQHGSLLLEFELFKDLDFDFSMNWDRMSDPKIDGDGNLPKKDDLILTYGLSLDF